MRCLTWYDSADVLSCRMKEYALSCVTRRTRLTENADACVSLQGPEIICFPCQEQVSAILMRCILICV